MELTHYETRQDPGGNRWVTVRALTFRAISAGYAWLRQVRAAHRRRRESKALYVSLNELDDRTLHDLGFHRSEISSIVAELSGEAERTRVRT